MSISIFNFTEEWYSEIRKHFESTPPFDNFNMYADLDESEIGDRISFRASLEHFRKFAKVKQ